MRTIVWPTYFISTKWDIHSLSAELIARVLILNTATCALFELCFIGEFCMEENDHPILRFSL